MSSIDNRELLGVPKHANQHRLSRLTMEVHTDELRIMASAVESYTDELIAALEATEKLNQHLDLAVRKEEGVNAALRRRIDELQSRAESAEHALLQKRGSKFTAKLISTLAKDIVENLVSTDSADEEATEQYLEWTELRIAEAAGITLHKGGE